jgi:hypothetical protein
MVHSLLCLWFCNYAHFSLVFSVSLQPLKTPLYGTLAGLLNASDADLGRDIVARTGSDLHAALLAHNFTQVKILVRFAAELVNANALEAKSLAGLLDQMLTVATEPVPSP